MNAAASLQTQVGARRMGTRFAKAIVAVVSLAITPARSAPPSPVTILADQPLALTFDARLARFVRVLIHRSAGGEPCIDEMEVYGPDGADNRALVSNGAKASASSCLPGYSIHRVEHLNDGRYGNGRSWIAAGLTGEWAQIELPKTAKIDRVLISRDREAVYRDRLAVDVEVLVSQDGQTWSSATRVRGQPAEPTPSGGEYVAPYELPAQPKWDELIAYAFACERHTWDRLSPDDHLSPLRTDRPALPGGKTYWGRLARMPPIARTLAQFEELVERLAAKGLDVTAEQRELAELRRRHAGLPTETAVHVAAESDLYYGARLAKRQAMLRDPDLAALTRVLFVKRHPYHASHNYSDVLDSRFESGGGVCVLEIPRISGRLEPAAGKVVTLADASHGIARDAVADFDGTTVYYAYRPERSAVAGWSPYWHLMSIQADGTGQRQLTDGPYHDFHPCPLPDGGLAFVSTRVEARFLCWRPQAFVLHRMDADGSRVRPLSFANLSEWSPTTMRDGRILWTRSEYLDKGADFGHTLWAIRPDGTHADLVFGNNTPNCYVHGREVPDSDEICCTLFSHGGDHNGPIGLVDRGQGPFDTSAVTNITPDVRPHYNMSWPRYECFRDPTPISRDYFLVSHAAADRFGIYVIDRYGNRELLYLDPAIDSACPTPLRPTPKPPALASTLDAALAKRGLAELSLVDVYQGLEGRVRRGEAKYLRVCQEIRADLVKLADGQCRADHVDFEDWYATPTHKVRGPHGWPSYVAKASLGLVEVAEDGSARFEVPAGRTLYFELLDEHFNELQRMRSVVQFHAGERRSCIGCHESRRTGPPLEVASAHQPAAVLKPPPWGDQPFAYERVVQPVWNAHCVRCHDGSQKGRIDLTANLDADKVPASYRALIEGGWVHYFDCSWSLRHHKAEPKSFGTLESKLWRMLDSGHHEVRLSDDDAHAVKCWIDLNCPLWPDYRRRSERPDNAQSQQSKSDDRPVDSSRPPARATAIGR